MQMRRSVLERSILRVTGNGKSGVSIPEFSNPGARSRYKLTIFNYDRENFRKGKVNPITIKWLFGLYETE